MKLDVYFFHVSPLELSRGRVEIPSTGLTLPHFCACPKSGPGFPIYMSWSFLCSLSWGESWMFVLLILIELLTHHCFKLSYKRTIWLLSKDQLNIPCTC
jgi:hypothetical protein